jgi:DNA-binding transcriptional LysR family regulator
VDTELARTFLTLVAAGSFSAAAERLHVTQSTVSARIQSLESQLGTSLFVRHKAGAVLTGAGRQFQRHAATLVRAVEQARQEVGVARGFRAALTAAGRFGLWEQFMLGWLAHMRADHADISVRSEVGFEQELMLGLVEGRLDLAVMYTPQSRPGLMVEPLFEDELIMVTTHPEAGAVPGPGHVHIDWGPEFFERHEASFPDFEGPALTFTIGWLGLQYILAHGGSGFFPARLVAPHIEAGRLAAPAGAPRFALPAYAVHPREDERGVVAPALDVLRAMVAERGLNHRRTTR